MVVILEMSSDNFSLNVGRYTLQLRQAVTKTTSNIADSMVSISRHFTFRKSSAETENDVTTGYEECDDVLNSTLAYKGLSTIPSCLIQTLGNSVELLDLSHNNISDVSFLKAFKNLTTLVLDHNEVTSAAIFPKMPKLKILWLNYNLIQELYPFIPNLANSCPNLQVLSLLCNRATPSYAAGSHGTEWLNYRFYVASKLPHLLYLDDGPITSTQRQAAYNAYGEPGLMGYIRLKYSTIVETLSTQPKMNGII